MSNRSTQTDAEMSSKSCDCESKYNEVLSNFKDRLETDHKKDKDKALQQLSEKVAGKYSFLGDHCINIKMRLSDI